jgi:hypothetical protein
MPRSGLLVLVLGVASAAVLSGSASGRAAAAPSVATEPSISGVPLEGNALTGSKGKWNGTVPITYTSVWVRCDEKGAACASIAGATATKYTLTSADIGSTIRFRVTATNASGSNTADSNPTEVVSTASGTPVSSKPPTISGTPVVGNVLTANNGTWVGATPITYAYQWQRCDAAGNACNSVLGANQSTYHVASSDVSRTMRVTVTATNSKGATQALSDATTAVQDVGGSGIIVLPNGQKSAPVADVPKEERLLVDQVQFSPATVSSRTQPIQIRVRVKDTRGYVIRDAFVFVRSTPIVTTTPAEQQTGTDGWITYTVKPESDFPLKNGYSVQFYVKVFRKGDPTLAGIYGSRLVQVATVSP